MRSKLVTGLVVGVIAFLLVTNPVVAGAAGQITGRQIKDGSVTGKDIKDKSITATDVSGSIAGPAGPAGAAGPQGLPGAPGAPGAPGISAYTTVLASTITTVATGQEAYSNASCPTGTQPLGGGAYRQSTGTGMMMSSSYPTSGGWIASIYNTSGSSQTFRAYAVCAKVAS